MAKLSRDILYAGVLGTAIGDALGVPQSLWTEMH